MKGSVIFIIQSDKIMDGENKASNSDCGERTLRSLKVNKENLRESKTFLKL
jgi:hypothetical protein